MNKLKLLTAISLALFSQASLSEEPSQGSGQLISNGKTYVIPHESQVSPIFSGGASVGVKASCDGISVENIGKDMLNNLTEAFNAIQSSILSEGTGVMLLMYSSPKIYYGMQDLRQATDFTMSISSMTCNDIGKFAKDKMEQRMQEDKDKCLGEGGNQSNCAFVKPEYISNWIKEKKEAVEKVLGDTYSLNSITGVDNITGGDSTRGYQHIIPASVKAKYIEEHNEKYVKSCANVDGEGYAYIGAINDDCSSVEELGLLYPLFSDTGEITHKHDNFADRNDFTIDLYKYYKSIFTAARNDKAELKQLLTDHKSVFHAPAIDAKDLNKLAVENSTTKANKLIAYLAVKYSHNNLDVYATRMEAKHLSSISNELWKLVEVEHRDEYEQKFRDASISLRSRLNNMIRNNEPE